MLFATKITYFAKKKLKCYIQKLSKKTKKINLKKYKEQKYLP